MSSLAITSRGPLRRRRATPLRSLLLASGVSLAAARTTAHAQPGSACAEQRLRVEGTLAPQWFSPVVKLCEALATMADVDPSAQLRVVGAGDDVIVEVTLGDGRSTLRRVRVPNDLPLTVEALVAIPPALPSEATSKPLPPAEPPARARIAPQPRDLPTVTLVPAPARRIALEVGGSLVGRMAGNPIYLSIGLTGYVGLRTGLWLLALTARWDGFQTVMDERPKYFEMTTAGGGFQVLRTALKRPGFALEGGLTAWLLGETQAFEEGPGERAGSIIDTRLGLLTRMLMGTGSLRWTASLDGELSPARVQRDLHIAQGLPILPEWSLGFGAGVAWEGP
ncbi:MAG: hypothetical protein JWN04_1256 [Myxococcaceae bacterium]|nr:hypothetical protein [Myxococcaceae bacterium]